MIDTRTTDELLTIHESWKYERTDRNGTRYFTQHRCARCGGRGIIPAYAFINGGECFECGGSGRATNPEIIKVYTPEHAEKLAKDREKRAKAKHDAKLAEFKTNINNYFCALGFGIENDEVVCYRVIGDTYQIKDELKAQGCKFNRAIGWYAPKLIDGYDCQRMSARDICYINEEAAMIEWLPAEQIAPLLIENQMEIPTSEWQGNIGDRLELYLSIDRIINGRGFRGSTNYFYIMHDSAGNCFTWSTSCYIEDTNKNIHIKGTVKDHVEYCNKCGSTIKQTVLTRCAIIKE